MSVVGHTRKPKSERIPPVWRKETDNHLQEYLLDTYLHFKTTDQGYTASTVAPWRKVFQQSASIHVRPGKAVTLLFQESVIHWNNVAQKAFITDDTRMVRTVYMTKKGRPAFYFYNVDYDVWGKRKKIMVSPVGEMVNFGYFGDYGLDGAEAFRMWRDIAEDVLGPVSMKDVYPGIENFGQRGFQLLGFDAMRCTTAMDATVQIFGKKCYRKDLVRAVGIKMQSISQQNRADILAWTGLFKRLVPVDWLVLSIKRPHHDLSIVQDYDQWLSPADIRTFRNIIAHLKPNERRNVMFNTHGTHHGYLITGTIQSYNQLTHIQVAPFPDNRENVKNLNQLHDLLVAESNRVRRERQRQWEAERYQPKQMFVNKHDDVEQFAFMLELDPRIDIQIARDYDTISGWSDYMVNCISSYFTSQALLGGIYEGGVLVANFELQANQAMKPVPAAIYMSSEQLYPEPDDVAIRMENVWRYELNQLLGRRNQKLDTATKDRIEGILAEYGIHLKSGRWA